MNRQYTRDDFLRMVERVKGAFDRPALTTDVIVGFPGETEAAFGETLDVVETAAFIHVHAFPYSPRPGTAAARWTREQVRGAVVNERIDLLARRAAEHSFAFRRQFVGEVVEVLVEREGRREGGPGERRHGRCERYFDVEFESADAVPGDFVQLRVEFVSRNLTGGCLVSGNLAAGVTA
jgi:tRNA A37 methylthiotransferase MiaB